MRCPRPIAMLGLGTLSAAGCALFETQDSFTLFPDAQVASHVEAGGDVKAGKPDGGRDAGHEDATLDAKADGTTDAAIDSARTDGTSDGGHRDAPSDGPIEDAHDAGHDAPVDAFHGPGYCAVTVPNLPPGIGVFCEDFDETGSVGLVAGEQATHDGSTLALQSTVARSFPNAVAISADLDGGSTIAYLSYSLPPSPATTYSVEFDADFSAFAEGMGASTTLISFTFGAGAMASQLTVTALPTGLGMGVAHLQVTESEPADGGPITKGHALPDGGISASTWTHVRLQLKSSGTTWFDYLSANDASLETLELHSGFGNAGPAASVQLGVVFAEGRGVRNLYIDNVLIEAQ